MGLRPGERVIRLVKSVYGLTAAPLEWYLQVNKLLTALGGVRCLYDPCCWVFTRDNGTIGVIGTHVDDFLIADDE